MYEYDHEKHIHKFDGRPLLGTTTVTSIVAKPALIQWAANQAIEAAQNGESWEDARYAHRKKKEQAASEGTDMHSALEGYVLACIEQNEGKPMEPTSEDKPVSQFAKWASENVSEFLWSEANCYSYDLWLGGICDVGFYDGEGNVRVGDFKSSKEAYFDHFLQGALYGLQIEENGGYDPDGTQRFKNVTVDGYAVFTFGNGFKATMRDKTEAWEMAAVGAVNLHRVKVSYENNK